MPPKIQKTKEQKAKAAMSGGRSKKKKWSKGKQREHLNNAVFFEKAVYERFNKEVPGYKLITPSILSERFKINVALAKAGIKELAEQGLITPVLITSSQIVYTKAATV